VLVGWTFQACQRWWRCFWCGMPTASRHYALARQLGGDADEWRLILRCKLVWSVMTLPALVLVEAVVFGVKGFMLYRVLKQYELRHGLTLVV